MASPQIEAGAGAIGIGYELLALAWRDPEAVASVSSTDPRVQRALEGIRAGMVGTEPLRAAGLTDREVLEVIARVNGPRLGAHPLEGCAAEGPPPLLSAVEIFAPLPPVPWLCEALDIAPGAPALVAGYGFSAKTLAAQDLALAVATGTRLWGLLPVRRGRVLHLDFEQGSYLTRRRYQRLARARGIDFRDLEDRLSVAVLPRLYLDADARDEIRRLCMGIDLVIVDSFRAACPRTDENSSEARLPLDHLGRVSDATGCTAVVIHHARKPTRDAAGGARMAVRGSGALYDACGSVLVFAGEKDAPITVAHEKARISGRTHPGFQLHVEDVEIDGDPRAGLRVSATLGAGASAPSSTHEKLKTRVLELIRNESPFLGGVNLLRGRLGANKADVSAAVRDLEIRGALSNTGSKQSPAYVATGTTP